MAGTLEKFAEELQWCIGQLELGLQRQSPDSRQAAETIKLLKILRSNKAPMVKKRQVMRSALGDYRKKMKDAQKKSLSGLHHARFQPLGSRKSPTSSRFLKVSYSRQQNAGLVRDDLHRNLSNLNLESATCEPGMTGSQIPPEAASSPAADSALQIPWASDDPSVSSNGTVLGENHVTQPSSSASLKGHFVVNFCETTSSGSSLASGSANPGVNSNHTNCPFPTQASASSSGGRTTEKQQVSGFKYEPSDNLFLFGFGSPENDDNQETVAAGSEIPGSVTVSHLIEESCEKAADSVYKYEKSENDFCFNFSVPGDES